MSISLNCLFDVYKTSQPVKTRKEMISIDNFCNLNIHFPPHYSLYNE